MVMLFIVVVVVVDVVVGVAVEVSLHVATITSISGKSLGGGRTEKESSHHINISRQ